MYDVRSKWRPASTKTKIFCCKNENFTTFIFRNQFGPLNPLLQLQHAAGVMSDEFHHPPSRRQLTGRLRVPWGLLCGEFHVLSLPWRLHVPWKLNNPANPLCLRNVLPPSIQHINPMPSWICMRDDRLFADAVRCRVLLPRKYKTSTALSSRNALQRLYCSMRLWRSGAELHAMRQLHLRRWVGRIQQHMLQPHPRMPVESRLRSAGCGWVGSVRRGV